MILEMFLDPLHRIQKSSHKTEPCTVSVVESAFSKPSENWPVTFDMFRWSWRMAKTDGFDTLHPQAIVDTFKCLSCMTRSSYFWNSHFQCGGHLWWILYPTWNAQTSLSLGIWKLHYHTQPTSTFINNVWSIT